MPLFLVATPIGNLLDISERALTCLRNCDLVLCEDTRTSSVLLQHYQIHRPLMAFHKFNEHASQQKILDLLFQEKTIAVISDAGTPCLCDPGQELVAQCRKLGLPVIPIPGACSIIAALSASGLSTSPFQFLGFAPKPNSARRQFIDACLRYFGSSIFFESPHRLMDTLKIVDSLQPSRQLALAKELTKKFETFYLGVASELITKLQEGEASGALRGEWVFMIEVAKPEPETPSADIEEACRQVIALEKQGLSRRDSILAVSHCLNCKAQTLYQALTRFD